jgi:hypothetical protein
MGSNHEDFDFSPSDEAVSAIVNFDKSQEVYFLDVRRYVNLSSARRELLRLSDQTIEPFANTIDTIIASKESYEEKSVLLAAFSESAKARRAEAFDKIPTRSSIGRIRNAVDPQKNIEQPHVDILDAADTIQDWLIQDGVHHTAETASRLKNIYINNMNVDLTRLFYRHHPLQAAYDKFKENDTAKIAAAAVIGAGLVYLLQKEEQ